MGYKFLNITTIRRSIVKILHKLNAMNVINDISYPQFTLSDFAYFLYNLWSCKTFCFTFGKILLIGKAQQNDGIDITNIWRNEIQLYFESQTQSWLLPSFKRYTNLKTISSKLMFQNSKYQNKENKIG